MRLYRRGGNASPRSALASSNSRSSAILPSASEPEAEPVHKSVTMLVATRDSGEKPEVVSRIWTPIWRSTIPSGHTEAGGWTEGRLTKTSRIPKPEGGHHKTVVTRIHILFALI